MKDWSDYLDRMDRMVREDLATHPNIAVHSYVRMPPATESMIQHAAAQKKKAIPKELEEFYRAANGLQLLWISKTNESYSDSDHYDGLIDWRRPVVREEEGDGTEETFDLFGARDWDEAIDYDHRESDSPWPFDGCIMIPTIQQLIISDRKYPAVSETVLGHQLSSLYEHFLPFDWFNCGLHVGLLQLPDQKAVVIVVDIYEMVSSYNDAFDGNVCLTFDSYMEGLLARKGVVDDRLFHIFMHCEAKTLVDRGLEYWRDHTTDLKEFDEDHKKAREK